MTEIGGEERGLRRPLKRCETLESILYVDLSDQLAIARWSSERRVFLAEPVGTGRLIVPNPVGCGTAFSG